MVGRPVFCRSFIGRNEELAYLRDRHAGAAKSHGGVLVVSGDAGLGKSRLLAEFCAPLAKSRWRIAVGVCLQQAQRPYGPLLDILAQYDGDGALAPATSKRDQLDNIVERFARASAKTGLVAIVEDIHWADLATLELLALLAPKFERLRVLLIASYRANETQPGEPAFAGLAALERAARGRRIELAPLGEADLERFVTDALTGHTLPDDVRQLAASISEGNPFFAEELLRVAVERQTAAGPSGARERTLPASIRATLLERWRRLAVEDRHILAQAAVVGRTFSLALLARIFRVPERRVLEALKRARAAQLIDELPGDVFRFRHALSREAIYGEFLSAELRPLHRAIALALEEVADTSASTEALAYHWRCAGETARAARYSERAGEAAVRVHAHEDAVVFFQAALESTVLSKHARASIVEKIAERNLLLSRVDRAYETYGIAADLFAQSGDFDLEARCRVRAAHTAYALGMPEPTAELERMLGRLDETAVLARSRVHLGIAWLAATFWFPTRAADHLAHVDARARASAPDVALRYHNVAAWVAMTLGDLSTFRTHHAAWIACARGAGATGVLAAAYYNGAACYSLFGLHVEAFANIDRALELARAERSRHGVEGTLAISAMCALMSGDLDRARSALAGVPPGTDNRVTVADAVAAGTLAGIHLGDAALAANWFDAAEPALLAAPETACGAGLAEALIRRGRPADAAELLHLAIPDCERPRGNALTLLAAARYAAQADALRARAQLAAAAAVPGDSLERSALALFDAYAGHRSGSHARATAHARTAAEGFKRLGFPLLEAAALESAGERDAAVAVYRRCGAAGDVRRLADDDRGLDGAAADAGRDVLSQREREIARLVARGNSNIDIARALAISHKTVEKHLGAVYHKMGFSSRTQLVAHIAAEQARVGASVSDGKASR